MTAYRIGLCLILSLAPQVWGAEPQWLTDARAREGKLGEVREVHSSDGSFSAKLPVAIIGAIDKQQDSYAIDFSVGSDASATCVIYPGPIDPAAVLRAISQETFSDGIEKQQGKIESRAYETINAGQFGKTPFLALSWTYRVNDGKELRVGALKQYAAVKQGHGIYCSHIDLGYVHTFESVVRALIESLEFHNQTPTAQKPFYYELSVTIMQGFRVGYCLVTLEHDAAGDVKAVQRSALLIPVTSDTLGAIDDFRVEFTRSDGTMISAVNAVSLNGALDANLQLRSQEGGRWHVAGEFKSKKLDETIGSQDPPCGWLCEAFQIRALLGTHSGAPRDVSFPTWLVTDPIHFTESRISFVDRGSHDNEAHLRGSTAGIDTHITVDAVTGQVLKTVFPPGRNTMTMERLDAEGKY